MINREIKFLRVLLKFHCVPSVVSIKAQHINKLHLLICFAPTQWHGAHCDGKKYVELN